jgi:hypothetical protein
MATSSRWIGLVIWGGQPFDMNGANQIAQDGGIQPCVAY